MRTKRTLLRLTAAAALAALAGAMMAAGRGHTVYLDNQPLEYGGTVYEAPWQVTAAADGREAARLSAGERGAAACMGQTFRVNLAVIWEEGGAEEWVDLTVSLPYNQDELLLNLPACLAGLPREVWLWEFVSAVPAEQTEDGAASGEGEMGDHIT